MVPRKRSKDQAKERLQLILIHDRIELSPKEMEDMKEELRKVLAKFLKIDDKDFRVNVNRKNRTMNLEADIPIKSYE